MSFFQQETAVDVLEGRRPLYVDAVVLRPELKHPAQNHMIVGGSDSHLSCATFELPCPWQVVLRFQFPNSRWSLPSVARARRGSVTRPRHDPPVVSHEDTQALRLHASMPFPSRPASVPSTDRLGGQRMPPVQPRVHPQAHPRPSIRLRSPSAPASNSALGPGRTGTPKAACEAAPAPSATSPVSAEASR